MKISSVACGFRPVKIDYSDYQKVLSAGENKLFFFHKRLLWHLLCYHVYCGMLQPFVLLQSNLSL